MAVLRKPKNTEKLSEFYIQNFLFQWTVRVKNHILGVPNMYVWNWEADFVSVTNKNFGHEYEIKISRSDFKADFKKQRHRMLMESDKYKNRLPSHFWYVVPQDLIDVSEVPDHAGLLYVRTDGRYQRPLVIKKAPRLSNKPLTEKQMTKIYQGSMWRYWGMRDKIEGLEKQLNEQSNNNTD